MAKEKGGVYIPKELYLKFVQWAIIEDVSDNDMREQVKKWLYDKADREIERDYYTKYKTAPSAEIKEQYRQKYLDSKGIPKDFRW